MRHGYKKGKVKTPLLFQKVGNGKPNMDFPEPDRCGDANLPFGIPRLLRQCFYDDQLARITQESFWGNVCKWSEA